MRKKAMMHSLLLCMVFILTACDARLDKSGWQYHSFEDVGVAMLLPGDFEGEGEAEALFRGSGEELRLTISRTDELFAGSEELAAGVSKNAEQAAELVTVNGVELVCPASSEGARSAEYYTIASNGDTCRILLSVGDDCKDKRAAALLSAVEESICGSDAVPAGSAVNVHPGRAPEQAEPDYLMLVNKRRAIPGDWADSIRLAKTANAHGDTVTVESAACKAFFGLQKALAAENVPIGLEAAYGGDGEHRTGLALDLTPGSADAWAAAREKLADYGFILRYPEDGTYYTGCDYEPWHIRYVGVEAAREIAARGLTLEEYLGTLPAAVDYLVLVNAENALPESWEDEVEIVYMTNRHGEDVGVERVAYGAYCGLRDALAEEGVRLDINSAYRTVASQRALAESYRKKYGEAYVKAYVAVPGYSEHHTGLAIDLYLESVDVWAKIHAHLAEFGFILRYPEGKESITGYAYEPWHIRFVGVETATEIAERGLTLEEYLEAA